MSVDSSHLPIIRLRHWNADSATKGSIALAHWEERSKFNRVWCSEHADLDKTNRTNFTEGLSPACAGVEVGSILAARERLIQESPHWAQTVFNISPAIWWIYPDFTSDIPPHSQSGLPLTPINSVWATVKSHRCFGLVTQTRLRLRLHNWHLVLKSFYLRFGRRGYLFICDLFWPLVGGSCLHLRRVSGEATTMLCMIWCIATKAQ